MYPPWGWGYPYPIPPNKDPTSEDPIKTMKKWMKFLKSEEEGKKKEKKDDKKQEPWDVVNQVAMFLFASMVIVGPLTYMVVHMINSSVGK